MRTSSISAHHRPRVQATVISETPFTAPNTQINPLALLALLSLFGGGCPTGVAAAPFTGFGVCPTLGTTLGLGASLGLGTPLGLGALSGGVPALCSGASVGAFGALPGISPFGASLVL